MCLTMFATIAQVAVTVTNPTNTTPNLAASYTSLANAVTAVNAITAMSGPVVLTCAAGSETAPAGGYSINSPGGTSSTNTITFTTSGTVTITASASLTAGSLTDAIFKLVGADYITISGFTMKENTANTTTAAVSNNMTEWGVALLLASATNGSQNNTIQNNSITLDRTYTNSFGIYSSGGHLSTSVNTFVNITNSITGPNNNNKFYNNIVSNVNMGIAIIGSTTAVNMDTGNDIGGSTAATGNSISNWGGAAAASTFVSNPFGISYCILVFCQVNENVSYNTLISAAVSGTPVTFTGIMKDYNFNSPTGTITCNISHNTITMTDGFASGILYGIVSSSFFSLNTATISISDNTLLNCSLTAASSSVGFTGILNNSGVGVLNMNGNIIKGTTSTSVSGSFNGITNNGGVTTLININNNQLGVAGSGALTYSVATTGAIRMINNDQGSSTCTVNINNNSIDAVSCVSDGAFIGIQANMIQAAAINIVGNQMGSVTGTLISYSGTETIGVSCIQTTGGNSSTVTTIQNNDFRGIIEPNTGSGFRGFIDLVGVSGPLIISGNTCTALSMNTSSDIAFIYRTGFMSSTSSFTCTNNSIVTSFNKAGAGGTVYGIYSGTGSATGSTMTVTGNNFSSITLTGNTNFYGMFDQAGSFSSGPVKTITGNTFSNITYGSGVAYGISVEDGLATTCSSNSITGFSGTGPFNGITVGSAISGNVNCTNNTISNITTTAIFYGVTGGATSIPTFNINGNTINSITCPNTTVIYITAGPSVNIYDNTISSVTSSSAAANLRGIHILNCSASNVYRNKLYGFSATAATSGGTPYIYGMFFNSVVTSTVNMYNNFIANLTAPSVSGTDVIRGIHIGSATASTTYNVYYNSIYLNASSTGTDFGTCALYHLVNSTATTNTLNLIDNIIVNTSTPLGTGKTSAFRRSSSVSLANYGATSDHNLFYAGLPSASRLIYYDGVNSDQTLAAFQTRVSPRDANDITVMPNFTSVTDLHLTPANCLIDGKGTFISGYPTDVDNAARNTSTPDMGADEFTATAGVVLAGVNGSATCDYRTVSGAGTIYTANACGLIARILPSGASPVSGDINTCVTLDATQQYFNSEPYVQRHYDIEPATANSTTTSATITLYFIDAEFVAFNTNTVGWPKLPTVAGGGNADPNIANLKVTQYHGTATTSPSTPGNYTANGGGGIYINPADANIVWNGSYWAVTFDITGFSGFYVHTNPQYALPVSLNYLNGVKQGDKHLLSWSVTCNTTPSVTLTLERSADNRNFTGLYSITADALGCNRPFNYTDAQPLAGINYYRLKIVDADGKITYSNTIALINATKGFALMNIAPNPVSGNSFKLNTTSATSAKMEVVISDMQGRIMNRQTVSLTAGFNSTDINVSNLAPGTYNIYGITADDKSGLMRFVKQ